MKKVVFFAFLCFIGCYPIKIIAQNELSESDRLRFETAFFEALKQKAIGNFDKAIESLDFCYALDSTNVAVLFERSKNFYWQKNYFEARHNIDKALKSEPTNIWLLEQAKEIALAKQNFEEAIAFQKDIVAINPIKKTDLILLYIKNNDKKSALELLNGIKKEQGLNNQLKKIEQELLTPTVVDINPVDINDKPDLTNLKSAYQKSQNYDVLKQILALEAEQKNFGLLIEDATKALEIFPSQAILYLYVAEANNALKNYQTALDSLENGIDFAIDKPMKKKYFLAYFESYSGLNNTQKANDYKKRASQL